MPVTPVRSADVKTKLVALHTAFVVGEGDAVGRKAHVSQGAKHVLGIAALATAGGLMTYAVDGADQFVRSAACVERILKGAKAGDLPVQQPTKFELVINPKIAQDLGRAILQSLLLHTHTPAGPRDV